MITFHSREACEALTPNGNMALIEITDIPNNYVKTWEQWNNKISISFFDADCVKFPKATWETHRDMLFTKELEKIFKSLAKRGTLAKAIPDPVAWQKEIRKDRKLPGR